MDFGPGIANLAIYPFFTMLSPLLACVSSVLQAFVTLQLVFSLNDGGQEHQRAITKKDV